MSRPVKIIPSDDVIRLLREKGFVTEPFKDIRSIEIHLVKGEPAALKITTRVHTEDLVELISRWEPITR